MHRVLTKVILLLLTTDRKYTVWLCMLCVSFASARMGSITLWQPFVRPCPPAVRTNLHVQVLLCELAQKIMCTPENMI